MRVQRFECKHSAGRRRKPDGAVYKSGFDRIHADDCKNPNSVSPHINLNPVVDRFDAHLPSEAATGPTTGFRINPRCHFFLI